MDSVSPFDISRLDVETIFESMPECVALVSPQGEIVYVSPDFYTLFQAPPETRVIGTHPSDWLLGNDTDARQRMQALAKDEQSGLAPTVYHVRRQDGSAFFCELTSAPLRNKDGRFAGLITVMRDVTTNKRLEQRLHANFESQEFLNHVLTLLYRPRDLKQAFEQVLEMIGIFTRASRVSLLESDYDGQSATVTMEWTGDEELLAHGTQLYGHKNGSSPLDKFVCVDYGETPSLRILSEARGVVCLPNQSTIPPDLYFLMQKWDLKSLAALPVFGVDKLFGLILIEYQHHERTWTEEDQDLLRNIARTVSNAVARQQSDEIEYNQRVLVETLRDITSVVNSDFTFIEVLEYILRNLRRVVPHSASSIFLLDEQGYLSTACTSGYPPEADAFFHSLHLPIGSWKTLDRIAHSSHPVIIEDTLAEPDWVEATGQHYWGRSYIGAAIRSRGRMLGILNVDGGEVSLFNPEHAVRLQAFADQAAVAIENAILYQEAHRRADQMTTLYEIGLTLASGLELEQVLTLVHDQVSKAVPFDQFYVALYNHKTDTIDFPLFFERGEPVVLAPRRLRETPGLTGHIIQTHKTLYLADMSDPVTAATYQIIRASKGLARTFVGVPLIAREQVVGVISMQSNQPGMFSQEQVRLLETMASNAALAIDNASIFKEMKLLAITDPLTGLFNRRHFTALGQVEVERALRYQRGLGVLMVDIDFFKKVNDSLGHAIGDVVLEGVSDLCKSQLRSSDIIGRYGGEEFAIVLPESSEERARSVAERIRALVAANPIITPKGPVGVTISVGLSLLSEEHWTLELLLDHADRAMYQAKQAGRNQVQVFSSC